MYGSTPPTSDLGTYMSSYVDAGLGEILRAILVLNDACGNWKSVDFCGCLYLFLTCSYWFHRVWIYKVHCHKSRHRKIQIQRPRIDQLIDSNQHKSTRFIHNLFHLKRGVPTGWKEFHHAIHNQISAIIQGRQVTIRLAWSVPVVGLILEKICTTVCPTCSIMVLSP